MPTPFRGQYTFEPNCIAKRPALAQHVGQIAALWALVEYHLGSLFSSIVGDQGKIGIALLNAVANDRVRFDLIAAAARERLAQPRFEYVINNIRSALDGPRRARNTVVHGLWAISDDRDDLLILVPAKAVLKMFAANQVRFEPMSKELEKHVKDIEAASQVMAYSRDDFAGIESQIFEVFPVISKLQYALTYESMPAWMTEKMLKPEV